MKGIADTGFLVAFANRNDIYHSWAVSGIAPSWATVVRETVAAARRPAVTVDCGGYRERAGSVSTSSYVGENVSGDVPLSPGPAEGVVSGLGRL